MGIKLLCSCSYCGLSCLRSLSHLSLSKFHLFPREITEPKGCFLLLDGVKRVKSKESWWAGHWERHLYGIPRLLRWWYRGCRGAAGHPQKQEHWGRRGGHTDRRGRGKRSAGGVRQEKLFWTRWAARSPCLKAVWTARGEVKQHKLNRLTHVGWTDRKRLSHLPHSWLLLLASLHPMLIALGKSALTDS